MELFIYEMKILRLIFGGNQEGGTWRRRSNLELYQSYEESDIGNFIKILRIKRAGHVTRMNEYRTAKKVFKVQPIGTRRRSIPNLRWIDGSGVASGMQPRMARVARKALRYLNSKNISNFKSHPCDETDENE
ncbi:uncharacterized protein TNCV_2209011 [Trichonephila clavipes]|nr:uncharacterized protein TNCV_2209011 [Trichonephila clavipes]